MAQELKDYNIMDIEAMDDDRLEKSSMGKIFVTRVYIKDEVDAVLAAKDAEIERLKSMVYTDNSGVIDKLNGYLSDAHKQIKKLKMDLEFLRNTKSSCPDCAKCAQGNAEILDRELDALKMQLREKDGIIAQLRARYE